MLISAVVRQVPVRLVVADVVSKPRTGSLDNLCGLVFCLRMVRSGCMALLSEVSADEA